MGWRYYYLETQNKIPFEENIRSRCFSLLSRGISSPSISFRVSFPVPSTTFSTRESARGERESSSGKKSLAKVPLRANKHGLELGRPILHR